MMTDLGPLEQQLSQLVLDIHERDSKELWGQVESISQKLANGLRTKDGPVDNHSILGKTELPRSLTSLFTLALRGALIPQEDFTSVVFEILRVAANICMDHDENRGHLLEAGLPQALVSLLEGYVESVPSTPHPQPLDLPVSHLKVVKTAIGVLLNASIGHDPTKYRLISLEAALTILKLSNAIYPPGFWRDSTYNTGDTPASEDFLNIRCGISNWAWRTLSELKEVPDDSLQIFTPDALPFLVSPLISFPMSHTQKPFTLSGPVSKLAMTLLRTDFEVLEASCMLIESLSLDIGDIRLSLARGLYFPAEHAGVPCLSIILDFIEHGTYPELWNLFGELERTRLTKAFDICKAALIKSVVEVTGEDSNEDVIWDDSEKEKPGGGFVSRMVDWMKRYVSDMDMAVHPEEPGSAANRDDLVICATLALGNLARREKNSAALLSPPYSLAPILTSTHLLSPSVDIKVKHGVLALLKHLSQTSIQSSTISSALGSAGVVSHIVTCGIWDEKVDPMAEIVQLSAIGVVKHMCNSNVEHTFELVLPLEPSSYTGLAQILALVKRSDSVPIRSEGTRVLVNVVKSLWSSDFAPTPSAISTPSPTPTATAKQDDMSRKQRKRVNAIRTILTPEFTLALTNHVGRSGKYPLLVNEGVVALSLLGTQREGASLVISSLTAPLMREPPAVPSALTSPVASSDPEYPPTTSSADEHRLATPHHALDMLVFVLKNTANPVNFPVEVRINVCSLLVLLGKHRSGEELEKMKAVVRPVLEKVLENIPQDTQSKEGLLAKAIKRALEVW